MDDTKKQQARKQARERAKRYYDKHKEKVLELNKKEVNCKYCGRLVNKGGLWKHQRTNVCKTAYEYLKNQYNISPNEIPKQTPISQPAKDSSIFTN